MSETQTLPAMPMPGEFFKYDENNAATVIASCWQTDDPDEGGAFTATLLVLNSQVPFYSVIDAQYDTEKQEWFEFDRFLPSEFDTDEAGQSFLNIIPATRVYEEAIGGY